MFSADSDSEAALDLKLTLKNDLKELRKEKLNIYNRLHSINEDAQFVQRIAQEEYPHLPLVANLRCGAWYLDPQLPMALSDTVYFKSTDGHIDQWDFNLRRANLHILPVIQEKSGIAIVDSTRKGKRLPDALSKTVPIWCCVINNAIAQLYGVSLDTALYTPPGAVSRSEATRIETKIPLWTSRLLASSFPLPHLTKPLRPLWITRSSDALPILRSDPALLDFTPVICLSASEQVLDGIERRHGYSYVQGSGDDHETWSQGLTPALYWRHNEHILASSVDNLEDTISQITSAPVEEALISPVTVGITKVNSMIEIDVVPNCQNPDPSTPTVIILQDIDRNIMENISDGNHLRLFLSDGKAGQMAFMNSLSSVVDFAERYLRTSKKLVVMSRESQDRSIGVVMVILQLFFDDNGKLIKTGESSAVTKRTIRTRLEWIQIDHPKANPSRVTMNRINEFLMSPKAMRRVSTSHAVCL